MNDNYDVDANGVVIVSITIHSPIYGRPHRHITVRSLLDRLTVEDPVGGWTGHTAEWREDEILRQYDEHLPD